MGAISLRDGGAAVTITGVGLCVPGGVGAEAALRARDAASPPPERRVAGRRCFAVEDFDPKSVVDRKKALKLMGPNIQFALAASREAWAASGREPKGDGAAGIVLGCRTRPTDFEEFVAVMDTSRGEDGEFCTRRFGREGSDRMFPLSMLRNLPNLVTAQVSIQLGLHGFSDTLTSGDAAGVQAVAEAGRVLARGDADAVLAGGADDLLDPVSIARRAAADGEDGPVFSQGAGVFMLERRGPRGGEVEVAAVHDAFLPEPDAAALAAHWEALAAAGGLPADAPVWLAAAAGPGRPDDAGWRAAVDAWAARREVRARDAGARLGWSGTATGAIEACFTALEMAADPAAPAAVVTAFSETGGLTSLLLRRGGADG